MAGLVVELAPEPEPKKKRKYTRRNKAGVSDSSKELMQLAVLMAVNTTVNTIFNTVAIFTKEKKWKLDDDESLQLSNDIDQALALLPEGQYELIIKYLTTISPLASLATTLTGIIKKRIETKSTTINANTSAGSSSNQSASNSEQAVAGGDWRFDPRFSVTGVNH